MQNSQTSGVINVLDLMTDQERSAMLRRYKNRVERQKQEPKNRVSSEIYMLAEFGYYFGWDGVQSVRNNEITIEEMYALLEGARKVWYAKLVESARAQHIAVGTAMAKSPGRQFEKGMKPFVAAMEINDGD